ncbi:MAG: helix-turn-helix domain-containing protein [Pseudomonadota bacterium]|jgi:AraC family transcriptional activator of pobA|nr:MAG: AraC family transcriptional regulator [Pseudomonadota bacterium]
MAARSIRRIPAYLLYGEAPQRVSGPLLHIETIEARSAGHHWKIEPHVHHVLHQVIFVMRGRGVVLADGRRSQYRPPAVLLSPAGVVHGFEFEPGTRGYVVSVSVELLRGLTQHEPAVAALFAQPATVELKPAELAATDLAQAVRMLAREFARPDARDGLALHGCLEVFLGSLLRLARELPNPADPVVGQRRQLMARFNELLEQRFRGNPSVAELARELHVSESRLRSVCLASTGQTPIQLIHARVLVEAKRQLHYTNSPVSEVAYALGFDDPAYFTRFFTRLAGESPRAFRRRGPGRLAARLQQ